MINISFLDTLYATIISSSRFSNVIALEENSLSIVQVKGILPDHVEFVLNFDGSHLINPLRQNHLSGKMMHNILSSRQLKVTVQRLASAASHFILVKTHSVRIRKEFCINF